MGGMGCIAGKLIEMVIGHRHATGLLVVDGHDIVLVGGHVDEGWSGLQTVGISELDWGR